MITIKDNTYTIGKLDAMTQLHISRRLLPILVSLGITPADLVTGAVPKIGDLLGPVASVLSTMPEEDVDYIVFNSLRVVRRMVGDQPAVVLSDSRFMFSDMDMPTILRLVVAVVQENFGGFFVMPPGASSTTAASPTAGAAAAAI